ncbi:hypothetical protein OIU84_003795 [Salix udensis]|uniref:Uncharacterized protein n=1 Tax=Salix udensis TaxID=889485 RepID=A0AAD6P3E3_9ROSI|nr:hypothetical protein OIU84_003795 [Salix udensis]
MAMAMYRPIKGQEEEDDGNRNRSLKSNDGDGAGGARTVVDENKSFILPTHSKQQRLKQQQQQQQRLVSLDVFRGLTVATDLLLSSSVSTSNVTMDDSLPCSVLCTVQLQHVRNPKLA